jgi:hypothetical protein
MNAVAEPLLVSNSQEAQMETGKQLFPRRDVLLSSLGVLSLGPMSNVALAARAGREGPSTSVVPKRFFNLQQHYSKDELSALYLKKYPHRKLFSADAIEPRTSVFFYWDPQENLLVNPFNLKADSSTKPGTYSINAEVYNFHPSSTDDNQVWSQLDTNVQMTFSLQAADANNDLFQWIVMAGLDFASQYLSGKDSKLLSLSDNNQLNGGVPASQQIQITDGQVSMMVGLAGQKKKSWWDTFIQLFQSVTNSPLFGLLPLPKLAVSAVSAIDSLLNQVEQQEKLVQVLQGKKLPFRLYDGTSTNPFLLKPGTWVVLDALSASSHIDSASHNIKDLVVDIPGQLFELKTKDGAAVDMTYSVLNILIPPVKTAGS